MDTAGYGEYLVLFSIPFPTGRSKRAISKQNA